MAEKYIGSSLSMEVGGGLGFYQGKVKSVNSEKQTITLTKVIHNGKPSPAIEVTISAKDILSLKILINKDGEKVIDNSELKTPESQDKSDKNIIEIQEQSDIKEKNVQEKTDKNMPKIEEPSSPYKPLVKENPQPCKDKKIEDNKNQSSPIGFLPFKPIKEEYVAQIPYRRRGMTVVESLAHGNPTSPKPIHERLTPSYENMCQNRAACSRSVPRKQRYQKQMWVNDRNDTTFGISIDEDEMHTEFDFEKNLALFDKEAVFNEISSTSKPDVVKQTDRKFRCDENVLKVKTHRKQIIVPASGAGDAVYTTDNGMLVPSITEELRINILSNANQHGLTTSRQLEMIGRGATEVIISAIGGSHRLEPGNSHQTPIVVVLCGAHKQGASGANCARQLESQGVRTFILNPPTSTTSPVCMLFEQELKIYALTDGKTVNSVHDLPLTVDLIVDTRYDLHGDVGIRAPAWVSSVSMWASSCRAPVVAIDPPSDLIQVQCPIQTRLKLCSVLPLAHLPDKGKLYLININIPVQVFAEFEIKYFSPFGSNMTIPLHPCQ